ncbi:Fucose permease [Hydrobacter penzbergensis]|uniref:Fucose permease n=2 Tax=Hydrobacter penzbergensis TaxID=1235997 RepID=A0A8X8LD27_9BACT|nr:Fucose permease [Hydrobacter penzbergensis]
MMVFHEFGCIFAGMITATSSRRSHRWAVAVFFFLAGLCFASWASRIPDIKQKLELNDAGLGAVLVALPVGLMTSLPIAGWLVSRWGSKKVVILAATGYPLTLVFLGAVQHSWQLAAVLFVFGLFGNLFNISVNTQAVGVEALYKRPIMASFHGTWSLAGFSGAAIGTLAVSGSLAPLYHFALICSAVILALLVTRTYLLPTDAGKSSQPIFAKPDAAILKLGLIAFGSMVCEGTMFDWSGVYFQKVVMVPEQQITLGYVAFMSTMAGGRFIGDRLTARLGAKRMLQCSGLVIAVGLFTAVLFPTVIPATAGFLLVGIGVSSVVPLVYSSAGKSKTMLPGVALAAVSTIGFFGFLFGPPLIGFIAQAASLRVSFSVIACFGLCTALLASFMRWN